MLLFDRITITFKNLNVKSSFDVFENLHPACQLNTIHKDIQRNMLQTRQSFVHSLCNFVTSLDNVTQTRHNA